MATKEKAKKHMTPAGRLYYPYLNKPDTGKMYSDDKFKTGLIVKKEAVHKSGLLDEVKKFLAEHKLDINAANYPIKDLASEDARAKKDFASGEFADCYLITAKSLFPVKLVDAKLNKVPEEIAEKIKGGDDAKIAFTMKFYTSNNKAIGKGVSFYLTDAQYIGENEAIGGGSTPFGELEVVAEEESSAEDSTDAFAEVA